MLGGMATNDEVELLPDADQHKLLIATLERGGAGRIARAVHALQRRDQQLVLVGVGEELYFVNRRHDDEHGTDAGRPTFSDS